MGRHHFSRRVLFTSLGMIGAWTLLIAGFVAMDAVQNRSHLHDLMLGQGRTLFREIVNMRLWNSNHGGVYVFVKPGSEPNPYLVDVERDLTLPDGRMLTLINPAYMTRQIAELSLDKQGVQFHITSLDPVRPANAPDYWEREALESFELNATEAFQQLAVGDEQVFRYMAPLLVVESCLACHGRQGYALGQVRGGISVTIPADRALSLEAATARRNLWAFALVWLMGLAALMVMGRDHARQRRMAREAEGARARFLALMNRETCTPLDGLLAKLEALQATELTSTQREQLAQAETTGRGLLGLMDSILDYASLEAGPPRLHRDTMSLPGLLESVTAMFREECTAKGLDLRLEIKDGVAPYVVTDVRALRLILFNLAGNAVKFTAQGSVTLGVDMDERDSRGRPLLRVVVRDTGVGIEAKRLETVFEPFVATAASGTKEGSGAGVGLYMVKRLVESMDGHIRLTSEPGKGTRACVTLPVDFPRAAPAMSEV